MPYLESAASASLLAAKSYFDRTDQTGMTPLLFDQNLQELKQELHRTLVGADLLKLFLSEAQKKDVRVYG